MKTIQEVASLLVKNPTDTAIRQLIAMSEQKAVKWIKNNATGDIYYFPAEVAQHAEIAMFLRITDFTKGVEIEQ